MVQGTITFIDRDGNEKELGADGPVVLCRCGGSSNKPFCDGTHRTEFSDEPASA
ncbi:MAG: CDGSH iron-sulfur domain-containing protein [Chloroflexi bacterium]|nr:CDGSH iron-sulfur domain-containing protein [Chloroflexota bacterium]